MNKTLSSNVFYILINLKCIFKHSFAHSNFDDFQSFGEISQKLQKETACSNLNDLARTIRHNQRDCVTLEEIGAFQAVGVGL